MKMCKSFKQVTVQTKILMLWKTLKDSGPTKFAEGNGFFFCSCWSSLSVILKKRKYPQLCEKNKLLSEPCWISFKFHICQMSGFETPTMWEWNAKKDGSAALTRTSQTRHVILRVLFLTVVGIMDSRSPPLPLWVFALCWNKHNLPYFIPLWA